MARTILDIEYIQHRSRSRGPLAATAYANVAMLPRGHVGTAITPNAAVVRQIQRPALPTVKSDARRFVVPRGKVFAGADVVVREPSTPGARAWLETVPDNGSTGRCGLRVACSVPPGGFLRYRLRIYVEDTPPRTRGRSRSRASIRAAKPEYEVVFANEPTVLDDLQSLMKSRRHVAFCVSGADALKLVNTGLFKPGEWKVTPGPFGIPIIKINPAWELVAFMAILAAALVAVTLILSLKTIILEAIARNYEVKISKLHLGTFKIGATEIDVQLPTLAIELIPR